MTDRLELLRQRLSELEDQIEAEFAAHRKKMRYRLELRRVIFEEDVQRAHRAARVRLWLFLRRTRPMVVLTAPMIYALIVPFVLLDLFVTLYQAICFPVYGITKVRRADYFAIDRHYLGYLNGLQKLNCVYCGYCNGLLGYTREIAGRTEQFWCPIKHSRKVRGAHDNYPDFVDYGDAAAFKAQLTPLREALRKGPEPATGPEADDAADAEAGPPVPPRD